MRPTRWLGCALFALAPFAPGSSRATEARDALSAETLADADPAIRREAAQGIGRDFTGGAALAPLLAAVALEDDDAAVRAAAAAAVEQLAAQAAEFWRRFLTDARENPAKHAAYHEIAGMFASLGAKVTATDVASGVHYATTDEARADALATLPLALRPSPPTAPPPSPGFELLCSHFAATGGPKTQAVARATLVLLAARTLRSATPGAPAPAPEFTPEAASWTALLDAKEPGIAESAGVVLGALARPGKDLLTRLALVPWLEVLAIQGRAAEPALTTLDSKESRWPLALQVYARYRLGARRDLLPADPGEDERARAAYATACVVLAALEPEHVRPQEGRLADWTSSRVVAQPALAALAGLGRLSAETRAALEGLLEEDFVQEPVTALARFALVRGTEAGKDVRAELLRDLVYQDEPTHLANGYFRSEVGRALPAMASELNPVRQELEALLVEPRLADEARLPLLTLLGRLPSADEGTAQALLAWLDKHAPASGNEMDRELKTDPVSALLKYGALARLPIEGRRAVADSLRALGRRAAAATPVLEALLAHPDPELRWRARRALAAVRTK